MSYSDDIMQAAMTLCTQIEAAENLAAEQTALAWSELAL